MIKTTNTGSPKVKKVTSTTKKRGRPVGSKKVKHQIPSLVKIMSDDELEMFYLIDKMLNSKKALEKEKKFLDDYYRWELHEDEAIPDSEATVEQVNKYKAQGYKEGVEATDRLKGDMFLMFVVILLGTVVAMILSTPTIISMFDACTQ